MIKRAFLLLLVVAAPALASEITNASVVAAMNEQRAHAGLPPLREDPRLDAAAADRMHDMEDLGYWAHESPDGRSPFMWLALRHYPYRFAGENLANGFETVELLMDGWMGSKGHRENILSVNYEDVGVAIIDGGTAHRMQGKSVVVMFGAAQPQP
jgi:uncharacterized protein YkwD